MTREQLDKLASDLLSQPPRTNQSVCLLVDQAAELIRLARIGMDAENERKRRERLKFLGLLAGSNSDQTREPRP
jgi:hypothetical protein